MQLPIQAIRCSLANITNPNRNKEMFVEKFREIVAGKELVCRVDECRDDGIHFVLIIDSSEGDGTNVNEEMANFIALGGREERSDGR